MTARTKILSRLGIYLQVNFLDKISQYLYNSKEFEKTPEKEESAVYYPSDYCFITDTIAQDGDL